MAEKQDNGFAVIDQAKQREIVQGSRQVAHRQRVAHKWTRDDARLAGQKGGQTTQRKKKAQMKALIALLIGLCWASLVSAAPLVVTDVRVTIGPTPYTSATVGWHFPVTLNPGDDLILTQDGNPCGFYGFCFDTSDFHDPNQGNVTQICVTVNGVQSCFIDTDLILTSGGTDIGEETNEFHPFALTFIGDGYNVELGYADNYRLPCTRCLPWLIRPGTTFEGIPSDLPWSAYDAGVIRITPAGTGRTVDPVPEPASLFLLGGGLLAVVWRLRH